MRKFVTLAMFATAFIIGPVSTAKADFQVRIDFGSNFVLLDQTTATVSTGGSATESHTFSPGEIDFSVTVGGFKVSASIADSNSPGGPLVASIDLSSLSIQNNTGIAGNSTVTITAGDTGFTLPTGNPSVLKSTASATAAGTNSKDASIAFNSYIDTTNAQFGTQQGTPTINLDPVHPGASVSDNEFAGVNAVAAYSLTQIEQITLANGDKLTDGSTGTTVFAPAPGGLLLALSGAPLLGIASWIRRRRIPSV
jgi:hypothetical protein